MLSQLVTEYSLPNISFRSPRNGGSANVDTAKLTTRKGQLTMVA